MATLSITRLYADGEVLFEGDLDEVKSDVESFMNIIRITDDNIQDASITASTKFVSSSVTSSLIATSAIATSKIADGAVESDALGTDSINTGKIALTTLTGDKFGTGAVTYPKLGTVAANRFASGYQIGSTSLTTYSTPVSTEACTITASGNRKVLVGLFPRTSIGAGGASIKIQRTVASTTVTPVGGTVRILRGATVIGTWDLAFVAYRTTTTSTSYVWSVPCATFSVLDSPSAGSTTYTFEMKVDAITQSITVNCFLVAMELL